ncbi:metabolite traffic protein EboE [Chitinophaga sp. GCM10012297]|uniref:Metabolite traffic protein EboE n=1 Tax=Chitinophaga chungangae TaxID=2821488 RepID=A0ABS3YJG2_9BACT|nr:metabolite traffic protein EboE [Chitinophaga chungangae]MBO9154570.1 metabolite traffic protein EboE [Chitinophaga chungangae]
MHTPSGHLTYCTNIHAGESWGEHFAQLQQFIPAVKAQVSPGKPFGIGLRLSNLASLELSKEEPLNAFREWLRKNDCYVYTMNGFPYGGFHHERVKDQVHTPDWATAERVAYTIRLFRILAALLPEGMEGGVSTSPLSYRLWHRCGEEHKSIMESATLNMLLVVEQLIKIRRSGGPLLHLDVEPEPDGMLENSKEYIDWYFQHLLPAGVIMFTDKFGMTEEEAMLAIKNHVQLCYDVCHFAVSYEDPKVVLERLYFFGLKVGKIQISAALKGLFPKEGREPVINAFAAFNENIYLHQVIARMSNDQKVHYPDMPAALDDAGRADLEEWRAHFHVPVFVQDFGVLTSTRDDISRVLALQAAKPFTQHLEVETYTWEVLPPGLKQEMSGSIAREMKWVLQQLELS